MADAFKTHHELTRSRDGITVITSARWAG